MTTKQTRRSSGLYSGSNGQLMKTERVRLGFGPGGKGIGVLFQSSVNGPYDLIEREARPAIWRWQANAAIGRSGLRSLAAGLQGA